MRKSEKVKVAQSCLTLCNPMDYTVQGILQARILEWVAFPFPTGSSQPRDRTQVSDIAGGFFTSWATREAQIWQGQLKDLSYAYQNALRVFKSMICNKGSTRRESESRWVVSDSLWPHGLYIPWNSLGKNTGVGSLSLLKGIFPNQGLNPGLPHSSQILYQLSRKGSPKEGKGFVNSEKRMHLSGAFPCRMIVCLQKNNMWERSIRPSGTFKHVLFVQGCKHWEKILQSKGLSYWHVIDKGDFKQNRIIEIALNISRITRQI